MGRKARPIAVIDCETDPFLRLRQPEPFLWGFYNGLDYECFDHINALLHYLQGKEYVIYAHNGGKFDYHFMLNKLEPYSDVLIINGRLARFSIGLCEFRDSYNILPIPLRDYKKTEIDYSKLERKNRQRHMVEIKAYLEDDCLNLYAIVQKFVEQYGRGLTLAGSAMKAWKKISNEEPPQSSKAEYDILEKFYHGGRVQVFQSGIIENPFSVVDINSAYPYAMLHHHPISTTFDTCVPRASDEIRSDSLYTVEAISRGAFPFRSEKDEGLSFPSDSGLRVFHITGWELLAALETKSATITRIIERVDFGKTTAFTSYINHFYAMKQAAPKGSPEYIFAKLFMNSLYGKFGANPEHYSNFGIVPTEDIPACMKAPETLLGKNSGPWSHAGTLGCWGLMKADLKESEERYYNVATAASITGFVRAFLWRHICKIRQSSERHVLYCDTDSIAFTGRSVAGFSVNNDIGGWSREGYFAQGGIAGKKLYAFQRDAEDHRQNFPGSPEWKTASKGVRLGPEEIMAIAAGAELSYLNPVPGYSVHAKRNPSTGLQQDPKFTTRRIKRTA